MQPFSPEVLSIDAPAEIERIARRWREIVARSLHRRGVVVAVSGGVDSALCAAIAVKAFGASKVLGLLMPERDSSPASTTRGRAVVEQLGIDYRLEDIAPVLEAIGCYRWRDEAIRSVIPAYGAGWKNKIVIRGGLEGQVNHFHLVARSPSGETIEERLPLKEYLQVVAATNYKQRIRKTIEYFHADRLHFATTGTPNRLEYDQGFFVKNGDAAADVKPIAHLYKTQVYALARHIGLPQEVVAAQPTTDTYSLAQGQDEFYFTLPYARMDLALWAYNNDVPAAEAAVVLGLDARQAASIYRDIEAKRRTTAYLHARAVLVEPVPGLPIPLDGTR